MDKMNAYGGAREVSAELAEVLEEAAHRVAEQGTSSEARLLAAMARVAARTAPGAAAALLDAGGTEVSRQRAFGVLHAHVVRELGTAEHAWLLDILSGRDSRMFTGRVA